MIEVIDVPAPSPDDLLAGLERIRRARRRIRISALLFVPAAVLLGIIVARAVPRPPWLQNVVFIAVGVLSMMRFNRYEYRWASEPCPRCLKPFIGTGSRGHPRVVARRCAHCGLYLDGRDVQRDRAAAPPASGGAHHGTASD